MFDTLVQDLRYSIKGLRKSPGFAVVALLAISIGVGANTAIFSLVNAVLLRGLDFKNPEGLVWIWSTRIDRDKAFFSVADFLDYREQNQTLDGMVAFTAWGGNLTLSGDPERLSGVRITSNAFELLGVKAFQGRCLLPEDGRAGSDLTVVLSYGLWQRQFGSNANIINKLITLSGNRYRVVGVLPPTFVFPGTEAELAIPLALETDPRRSDRDNNFLRVFARLKSGATQQNAQEDMAVIARGLQEAYPNTNAKKTAPRVVALHDEIVGGYQTALLMLMGAVGVLLLIACSNLANMLLSRASARYREMAIRGALGASRARLVRQLLTETSVLALLGGLLGLILAWQGVNILIALSPAALPRASEVNIDGRVLLFTLVVSMLSGIIFGLLPALHATRINVNDELKGSGKGTADSGRRSFARSVLVVAELAFSLVLLITAGLLVKSFMRIQDIRPGFDSNNLLLARISLPSTRYSKRENVTVFLDKVLPSIETLPGVVSVSAANCLPLSARNVRADFVIVGRPPVSAADMPGAQSRLVSPGYFQNLGIPILAGREFALQDNAQSRGVVIIDETLARRYWPNDDAVGSHISLNDNSYDAEIVGVVGSVKHFTLDEEPMQTLYAPIYQVAEGNVGFLADNCNLAIHTDRNPMALQTAVRGAIRSVDGDVPVSNSRTMEQFLAASTAPRRFNLLLLAVFAGTGLLLAASGIYAVMSFSVTQRSQEIGIRMALGARPLDVMRLILGHGLKLVLIGIGFGLVAGFISTRFISSLLFGIGNIDPLTFILTPLVLLAVSICACYFPARKARKVDPIITLRAG